MSAASRRPPLPPGLAPLLNLRPVHALIATSAATACHLVGGTLRDAILRQSGGDLDVVVAGRGAEIAQALSEWLRARLVNLGGREFAAYRLVLPDPSTGEPAGDAGGITVIDLWDRGDMSLHDDLARRDLTINSLALDPRTGNLTDPFRGIRDLRLKRLRATTPDSFTGDPLRVLRLARLAQRLAGFTVEPETFQLARQAVDRLGQVAAERIRDELWMILSAANAGDGLRQLSALGAYPALWSAGPHSHSSRREVGPLLPASEARASEIDALRRRTIDLAQCLGKTSSSGPAWDPANLPIAAWAATCRYELASESSATLRHLQDSGYLSAKQAAAVAPLLGADAELPPDRLGQRRFLHRFGRAWLTAAASAGAQATGRGRPELETWRRRAAELCALALAEGADIISPPRLLDGQAVSRLLGIQPGPQVGRALAALTAAQVDGHIATTTDATAFVVRWAGESGAL